MIEIDDAAVTTATRFKPISDRPKIAASSSPVERGDESVGATGFFAVDRRAWHVACRLGMNAAVCYLILARGTQRDNRTTFWSTHAIEGRTRISRNRVPASFAALESAGLVTTDKSRPTRPRRYLSPAHLLAVGDGVLPPLTTEEEAMMGRLPLKTRPKLSPDVKVSVTSLVSKGYARRRGSIYEVLPELLISADPTPDWIWLPNSIVDGVSGKDGPVEQLRRTQEVATLRLFVDMYHLHSLSFEGGIPSTLLCKR